MSLADYYRVLGLRSGADFEAVKSAYRLLARRYHPDINPEDQRTKEKFIQVTQAYRAIAAEVAPDAQRISSASIGDLDSEEEVAEEAPSPPNPLRPQVQVNPQLSIGDQQLKQQSYEQLQHLFQGQRFPRAIALVEGLAQRMPLDREVRQWQAITYQRWGRHLIHQGQWQKAQPYLQKALRTDPHNKSLQQELRKDFQHLEQVRGQTPPSAQG
ncbi:molecular chaperone DnaJ [filamentous cyanobacterium CCP5]|nr:molecular chaperone DnaJ [filamentous cyanobacterium CCP5]